MSWKIAMQFTNNSIWMKLRAAPDAKHEAAKAGCAWQWIDRMKCRALSEAWHNANFMQPQSFGLAPHNVRRLWAYT